MNMATRIITLLFCYLLQIAFVRSLEIKEGDTGYDYNDNYYYEEEELSADEPTFILSSMHNLTVVEGDSAMFFCEIDNLGKYKLTWRNPDNFALTFEDRRVTGDPRFSVVRNFIKEWNLMIHDVKRSDAGLYTCAINTEPVQRQSLLLTVEYRPEVSIDNARIGQQLGRDTILECYIDSFPKGTYNWEKEGNMVEESSRHSIKEYDEGDNHIAVELRINQLEEEDYGVYKCVASNYVGMEEGSVTLYRYTSNVATAPTIDFGPTQMSSIDTQGIDEDEKDDDNNDDDEDITAPEEESPVTVTASEATTAILPCKVSNVGEYVVAWMYNDATVLTYEEKRIVDDQRFSIQRRDINVWNLVIEYVRREDEGAYTCLVVDANTYDVTVTNVQLNVVNSSVV